MFLIFRFISRFSFLSLSFSLLTEKEKEKQNLFRGLGRDIIFFLHLLLLSLSLFWDGFDIPLEIIPIFLSNIPRKLLKDFWDSPIGFFWDMVCGRERPNVMRKRDGLTRRSFKMEAIFNYIRTPPSSFHQIPSFKTIGHCQQS